MNSGNVDNASFWQVCLLLEKIEGIQNSKANVVKKNLVHRTLSRWFSNFKSGDLFALFRLLVPERDHERVYQIKEKRLSQTLSRVLGIEKTERGHRLLTWRTSMSGGKIHSNLSTVLQQIVQECEHSRGQILTVKTINEGLDLLAELNQDGDVKLFDMARNIDIIKKLYLDCSSLECKWLSRLILKDLQLDMNLKILFDSFHTLMWRVFCLNSNLKSTCSIIVQIIVDGIHCKADFTNDKFLEIMQKYLQPVLGVNIGVMECGRGLGVRHVINRLPGKMLFVETKYDGERVQAHINLSWPEKIRIFSKSGRDSTKVRQGCHQQLLDAFVGSDAILEGELLVYNEENQEIEPFGTVQLLKDTNHADKRHFLVVLFDLIYLNGRNLMRVPLHERKRLLFNSFKENPRFVEYSPYELVDNRILNCDDSLLKLQTLFSKSVSVKVEGLIIKDADSPYLPYSRRYWMKLKQDYIEGFGDTAEFTIVGASYGKNGGGLLNCLVIGCLSNKEEVLEDLCTLPQFSAVFTVSLGLTEDNWVALGEKMEESGLSISPPSTHKFRFPTGFRCDIDYYLEVPLVVELKGSGFVKERGQPHFTLRFPRIVKIRFDREFSETISFQEMQDMANRSLTPAITEEEERESDLERVDFLHQQSGKIAPTTPRTPKLQMQIEEKVQGYYASEFELGDAWHEKLKGLKLAQMWSVTSLITSDTPNMLKIILVAESNREHILCKIHLFKRRMKQDIFICDIDRANFDTIEEFLQECQCQTRGSTK